MKSWQRTELTLTALIALALTSGLFAQDQQYPQDPQQQYPPAAQQQYPQGQQQQYPQDQSVGNNPASMGQDQANPAGAPANDPPARVARIQYISGEVSMQPGGVNDWVTAGLNRPLTTSDRVWTDKDSRAELNVGTAFIRMNSESSVTLTNVSDNTVQIQLDQGTLELTVRHLEPGEIFEIDTPNLAFTVMKSGVYRIDVPPNDNQTWVTVRKGNGQATGQGPAVKVSSGEQIRFTGQGSLQHDAFAAPTPDGFEDWAQVRDKRLEGSESAQYVAPGVIGREDLDYYGTWRVVPNYGAIWVPTNVAAGWAPYRYGHWAWINPWGWTWVDDAPWGFAPFHYGRWVSYGGYWGWAPGPVAIGWRPYYAPALVGWVGGAGWGFGISVGFGGGGCGWFALGFGEPYYPWYHGYRGGYVSNTYIRNVNVTNTHINNITNVTNNYYSNRVQNTNYVNRAVPGAVTAAPASALANGQNIARVGKVVPTSEAARTPVVRSANATPNTQAMLGGRAPLTSGIPPKSATNRPVVTNNAPPAHSTAQAAEVHTVPAAPATLGVHNPNSVPTPPQRNSNTATQANANYPNQNAASQHVVPRPPSTGGPAPQQAAHDAVATTPHPANGSNQSTAHSQITTPPSSATHAAPPAHATETKSTPAQHTQKPKENNKETAPKGNPGMASANVPRPPSSYAYKPASSYAASSYSGNSSYGGGSRSYSPSSSTYGGSVSGGSTYAANRSSYGSATPSSSYHAAPTYSAHMSAPAAPHYSAPSTSGGHYSAPSYSGGHSSGGSSRSSSGTGSHR